MAITLAKITDTYPDALTQGRRVRHVGYGMGTVTQSERNGLVSVRFDRVDDPWSTVFTVLNSYDVIGL